MILSKLKERFENDMQDVTEHTLQVELPTSQELVKLQKQPEKKTFQ